MRLSNIPSLRAPWLLAGLLLMPLAAAAQTATNQTSAAPAAERDQQAIQASPLTAGSDQLSSTAADRTRLAITLPRNGPALWVDERDLALLSGRNQVAIHDLPATLIVPSLHWDAQTLPEVDRLRTRHSNDSAQPAKSVWQADLFAAQGGNRRMRLHYQSTGFAWQPSYDLALAADSDQGQLTRQVALINQTGTELTDAALTMISANGGRLIIDRLPEFAANETLQLRLAPTIPIRVERDWQTHARGDQAQFQPERSPVHARITLMDIEPSWPTGTIQVRMLDTSGAQALMQGRIEPYRGGTGTSVELAPSTDITFQRETIRSSTDGLDSQTLAWQLRLTNQTEASQSVTVIEQLSGAWTLTAGEENWTRVSEGLRQQVTLTPGESRDLSYTVRIRR